ncbi:MAG: methyltransferase domain-containing protein [Sciscionella sp.]
MRVAAQERPDVDSIAVLDTDGGVFDSGLQGQHCWLEFEDGKRVDLAVQQWISAPDAADEMLLGPCSGPTLDVGCGPGRLAAELGERGIIVLGVDTSPTAVRLTRVRGGNALRRDVFGPVPGEGRWAHVLLADGNIGIGGDPVQLLRRAEQLLAPGGNIIVEVAAPGTGLVRTVARLATSRGRGRWFRWAVLGTDGVDVVAAEAGLVVRSSTQHSDRHFVELVAG